MIISFSVRNFKSLRDEITLHMGVANTDDIHSNNIAFFEKNKRQVLRTAGIWGPNASGKSNLLEALGALWSLVSFSHKNDLDEHIKEYKPFRLDQHDQMPVFFELDFIANNKEHYIYSVEFLKDKILSERLEYYASIKASVLFERKDAGTGESSLRFSKKLKGGKASIKYLTNQCFLSVAGNTGGTSDLITNAYRYIRSNINIFSTKTSILAPNILQNEQYLQLLSKLLHCADTGIDHIKSREHQNFDFLNLPPDMPDEVKKQIYDDFRWQPLFFHNNSRVEFSIKDESQGTKRLYNISPLLLLGLASNEVFIFDELDSQLHFKLVEMIIRMFHDKKINGQNPQLIFTCHNTALMDQDLLRRDQIWFTQKDANGITELSCLDEYEQVRSDTNFEKWYREERFDAVPEVNYSELRNIIAEYVRGVN